MSKIKYIVHPPDRRKPRLLSSVGEHFYVFCVGGVIYSAIEVLWRGFTHWSMGVTGGLCLTVIFRRIRRRPQDSLLRQCVAGSGIITGLEFLTGCIVNLLLRWNVWDYSHMPFNILGQICLPFTVLWGCLTVPAAFLCRYLDEHVFGRVSAADKKERQRRLLPLKGKNVSLYTERVANDPENVKIIYNISTNPVSEEAKIIQGA